MLTLERELKNKSTMIELKSANNMRQKDQIIEKLGGAIKACIDKLKRLRTQIQAQTDLRRIARLMGQFQKSSDQYNEYQISLAEIDQSSELCKRVKAMNKEFIETYDPEQLKKKFQYMKAQRTEHLKTQNQVQMNAINQQQLSGQLLASDKHAIRHRILMQQKEELLQIERMLNQVKDIATKTSVMINSQGQRIELSLQKMKKANMNLKDGRTLLEQTNQYQQDTNKKCMAFCCLTVIVVSIIVMIIYSSHSKEE